MSEAKVDEELLKMLKLLEELKQMCRKVTDVTESISKNEKKDPTPKSRVP